MSAHVSNLSNSSIIKNNEIQREQVKGLIRGKNIVVIDHQFDPLFNVAAHAYRAVDKSTLSYNIGLCFDVIERKNQPLKDRIVDIINTPFRWAFGGYTYRSVRGDPSDLGIDFAYKKEKPSIPLRILGTIISLLALPILLPFQIITLQTKWDEYYQLLHNRVETQSLGKDDKVLMIDAKNQPVETIRDLHFYMMEEMDKTNIRNLEYTGLMKILPAL